jgi:hypothetical protein
MSDNYFGGVKAGATSVSTDILIRSKTDNTALTGLVWNTGGNIASYRRQGAARVAITLATQTVTGAYSSGGFVETDATNQPGLYRLDVPDAAFAAGVDYVTISFVTTSGYVYHERIPLSSNVIQSGDSYGRIGALGAGLTAVGDSRMTHLDADVSSRNATAPLDAAGTRAAVGLATANADTQLASLQSDTDNIQTRLPAALTANGNIKASLVEILTTALTETAGLLAGGFKKFFNIATPAATMDHGVLVDTATAVTTVNALATDSVSAGALKTDAVTEIGAGVLAAATAAPIAANVTKINNVVINGSGVLGDEFQP